MSYEVVERKLRMVPEGQLDEVLSFIDGILDRCQKKRGKGKAVPDELGCYNDQEEEEKALKMMMAASMHDIWETVKDDTW